MKLGREKRKKKRKNRVEMGERIYIWRPNTPPTPPRKRSKEFSNFYELLYLVPRVSTTALVQCTNSPINNTRKCLKYLISQDSDEVEQNEKENLHRNLHRWCNASHNKLLTKCKQHTGFVQFVDIDAPCTVHTPHSPKVQLQTWPSMVAKKFYISSISI